MFDGFIRKRILANGVEINLVQGGAGPPLLLLHGHPQTHAIWHKVAGALAERFTVVATDLRGYGDSGKPRWLPDHSNYSKRVMAQDHLEHDREDLERGRKVVCPLLALWGARGAVGKVVEPLEEWRRVALDVRGKALDCGHYIPEEAPGALLAEVLPFFLGAVQ